MNKPSTIPFIVSLAVVIGFLLGQGLARPEKSTASASRNFGSKFDAIMEAIDRHYVDTIDREKFVEQAIGDILNELDPHSSYIPASDMKAMRESIDGEFGGVGIRFSIIQDELCVTHVVSGSPAEKAGVQGGDRILAIGGKKLDKKNLNNSFVMKNLKGAPNSTVAVELLRNKKKIRTEIKRGLIDLNSISASFMLTKNIGYIRLDQFSLKSAEEFRNAALALKVKGMDRLVFDLRDNGGGVLGAAISIVDEFLPADKLIVYTKGAHKKEQRYTSTRRGILLDIPVVILINQNSASASEIVAGALQDNDRATIIGRRSFGKGLVQEDIPLQDNSNLRLTVARYYTPTGRSIQRPYGEDIDYHADIAERYDRGELYQVDSTLFVDSLKYTTPKGKVVYGGGGIMPDIFHPLDSSGYSFYFTELRYTGALNQFSFFEWDKIGRNRYKSLEEFNRSFKISDAMLQDLIKYAEKQLKVKFKEQDFKKSKFLLIQFLKAEFARHIWVEQGLYLVLSEHDQDIARAIAFLKTGK